LRVAALLMPGADRERVRTLVHSSGQAIDMHFADFFDASHVRLGKTDKARLAEMRAAESPTTDDLRAVLRDAEVVLSTDLPVDIATLAPGLRWVQGVAAGYDHLANIVPSGARLTTASGVGAGSIAEFVFARVLEVWKDLRTIERQQRDKIWQPRFGRTLRGNCIGIVGYGAIGQAVAVLAKAFGMRVVALRRDPSAGDPLDIAERVGGPADLPWLLGAADIVVLSAPDAADTANLMGAAQFAATKRGALFCNVARGSLVDEAALGEALRSGQLGAAIVDVTRAEPVPADSPLWDLPNLYLSPHCAVALDTYMDRVVELFLDNARRYRTGEKLRNLVKGG
jgi:phosphoglycerate dehydrogenase-like enzyme